MKVLFDQGTPVPLRKVLVMHHVVTAFEMGWSTLTNGEFLRAAEAAGFEVLVTTDKNMRYQQPLALRRIAVLVLPTTSWPAIRGHAGRVAEALAGLRPGDLVEVAFE